MRSSIKETAIKKTIPKNYCFLYTRFGLECLNFDLEKKIFVLLKAVLKLT